ncbi:unnamed protein product [Paramecium octaurelia]|uniref:Uncharacterized protein n=1 Tax=Paramecium octaurelia TaxID=43137 RepID=A0A8S1XI96_PAROT|nr:unnamed protein product [Paramecium octaurelia]
MRWEYQKSQRKCIPICGDSIITYLEECDDGNAIPYDGCYQCKFSCQKFWENCKFGKCLECLQSYRLIEHQCIYVHNYYDGPKIRQKAEFNNQITNLIENGFYQHALLYDYQIGVQQVKQLYCNQQSYGYLVIIIINVAQIEYLIVKNNCLMFIWSVSHIINQNQRIKNVIQFVETGQYCKVKFAIIKIMFSLMNAINVNRVVNWNVDNVNKISVMIALMVGLQQITIVIRSVEMECRHSIHKNNVMMEITRIMMDVMNYFQLIDNTYCTPICGDGIIVQGLEECEDLNDIEYDGCYQCNYQCEINCSKCIERICQECIYDESDMEVEIVKIQLQCGDGLISNDEECDDWNILNNDGCSSNCNIEAG